jgi:hypothetical protein
MKGWLSGTFLNQCRKTIRDYMIDRCKKFSSAVSLSFLTVLFISFFALSQQAYATFSDCAIDWRFFENNPGFISDYTYQGNTISDHENTGTGDPTHGPANVPPAATDLASFGDAATNPGTETTPFFGYYNGGTSYDAANPLICSVSQTTCQTDSDCPLGESCIGSWEDDYIFFRMRIRGDPSAGGGKPDFSSYHWNILLDLDADGYKEYWVDLEGSCPNKTCGGNYDRLNILYNNDNRQDIVDPDAAGVRVDFFQAQNTEDFNAACTVPNSGYCSVTTSQSCTVDSDCPGGEICFISPGYSHTRSYAVGDGSGDYYIDIQVPMTAFDDSNGNQVLHPDDPVAFVYSTGASNNDPLQKDHMMDLNFLTLFDPITFGDIVYPNGQPVIEFTDASLNFVSFYTVGDNIYMWVTDPLADTTGGQDQVTVTVTNPRTGDDETITLTETENDSGIFTGCTTAVAPSAPACLLTRDTGPQSDNDGYLEVASGDTVYVSYTNASSQTVTDEADIVEPCEAYIQFTRANGLPSDNFEITDDPGTSDQLYVTITLPEANTDPGSAQTIQVILHGTQGNGTCSISIGTSCTIDSDCPDYATGETCDNLDKQTLTLTETGDDTGVFRNATGLETQISDGTITSEDDLWEDVDQGVVTAEFDPSSYSICTTIVSTSASLFYIAAAGRVYFTNSAGTLDVDLYTPGDEVFVKVVDENACSTPGPPDTLTVTVESSFGSCSVTDTTICTVDADCPGVETCVARSDSETLTVEETASGSFVFINSSPSVLTTATYSGGTPTLGDNVIELPDSYNITAIYNDYTDVPSGCSGDGDGDSGNDNKTDTALFNAPDIIITEVLFYPALTGSCDTTTTTKCVTDADCPGVETCITDPALAEVCQQTEYIELYNSSPLSVNATGYRVADEDLSVNYTIPSTCSTDSQKPCDADSDCPSGGTCTGDLILASGEHIIISFYDSGSNPPDVYDSGTYYLFDTTSSSYPSDFLGDGGYVLPEDRADQVSLYDSSATVRDYTGYSFNLTPSIDFYGDDSPAVSRDIWQDNSFLNVSSITSGYAIERVPVGQDTNSVDDWQQMSSVSEVCNVIILTRAVVSKFSANRDGDHVAVEWETTSEIGTVGFHLYRSSAIKGTYERVNKRLLPSLPGSLQGGKYRFIDKNALADASFTYRLVEVETRGRERSFGPYAVDRDGNVSILKQSPVNPGEYSFFKGPVTAQIYRYTDDDDTIVVTDTLEKSRPLRFVPSWKLKTFKPPKNAGMTVIADTTRSVTDETAPDPDEPIEEEPPADDFSVQTHAVTENQKNQTEQRKASQARAHELQKQWTGNRIKISVTKAGLYFLENSDIAEPLDVSAGDIKEMLSSGRLLLTNRENTVSYLPDEDLSGIYFYAKGIESIYTDEDIFWLEEGKGKEAKSFNRKNPLQLLEGQIFIDSIHFEEDHHSDITVVDEPESDYFFWDYIFGGYPGYDSKSFALQTPGAASNNALATLTVSLQGITDTNVNPDHHVIVTVNSTILGETFWRFGSTVQLILYQFIRPYICTAL